MGDTSDTFNDQIRDSVNQLNESLTGLHQPFTAAAAYHTVAHTLSLGLHNVVAQQQHSHILRNALTTAAAKALLEGKHAEAEAVLKLAESRLVNPNFSDEISQIRNVITTLHEDLQKIFSTVPSGCSAGAPPPRAC